MKLARPARVAFLALVCVGCGQIPQAGLDGADGGEALTEVSCSADQECPLGQACVDGRCSLPREEVPTSVCLSDADCPSGWQCVKSTGTCLEPKVLDAGTPPDNEVPACFPGQEESCGESKLGECRLGISRCEAQDGGFGYSACVGAVNPAVEICDGLDNDCDGLTDEGLPDVTCGIGACARTQPSCVDGMEVACQPGAPASETCDGLDNDCNGSADDGIAPASCGVGACARTVPACDNGQAQTCTPGLPVLETCNGLDDDCDGTPDNGLGTVSCGVGACARTVQACVGGVPQTCTPGSQSAETCNGIDDDCDGQTDEDLAPKTCGKGICQKTVAACVGGVEQDCVPGPAQTETCNGADDDCDGTTDEGCSCIDGQTQSCYGGPAGTVGVGLCKAGTQTCSGGAWGACVGEVKPSGEVCNGKDDDCNGSTDEGLGTLSCGKGECVRTVAACSGGVAQTCTPGAPGTEVCNGKDDDCDGTPDDNLGTKSCGIGPCARTVQACLDGASQTCTPGTPGAEVCNGQDDDCDGTADDGVCGPTVSCPADQTVNPNTTVTLNTTATSPVGRAMTCAWSVVNRPGTSSGTFTNGTSCTSASYFADVVGNHRLRFTVTDSEGLTASCEVVITVKALGDLWVELTWDRNNDLDLHLLHPSAGDSHKTSTWSRLPYDCFWYNKTPSWDAPGTGDDPSLDRDDMTGKGPENVRINVASSSHPYTIGVHWFRQLPPPNEVTATVKVYCGGVLTTTRTRTFPKNDEQDLWVVGSVQFNASGTCSFTSDGTVLRHIVR